MVSFRSPELKGSGDGQVHIDSHPKQVAVACAPVAPYTCIVDVVYTVPKQAKRVTNDNAEQRRC